MNTTRVTANSTYELELVLKGHTEWVRSLVISKNGAWVVSGSDDNTVKVWDLNSGQCRNTFRGHATEVNCVAITPDGTRILSGSDERLRIWDRKTGRRLLTCRGHMYNILSIATLPDNRRALTGSRDGKLILWDIHSGEYLKSLDGHKGGVYSVAVSQDCKRAVSGSSDSTIQIWDLETGKRVATLKGHARTINSVQITPDERFVVSGSDDNTVKLWDLAKGTCLGTLEGHRNTVNSVAVSKDSRLVASTGFTDHTLRLWDLKSGTCVQIISEKETPSFISVAFSPDGSRLFAGTAGAATINIYRLTASKTARPLEPLEPVEISERYTNAKVVLVGESGVGKSGLAYRLIQDEFVKTDSTHGMQIWPLDLPNDENDKEEGIQREAILWDLAGQEDYRLIHQLFLDETALALVLFNPQKDDPFAEVVDWLKALDAATKQNSQSRKAQKLLIAARADVGTITVSQKKINRFLNEQGLAAYLSTSAKTGQNCSDVLNNNQPSALKALVSHHIPWDTLPWTSSTRLLRELKKAVFAMRKDESSSLLRFPELTRRLKEKLPSEIFTRGDVRTAATLLGNHGLVMSLAFGDLVLLKPELLNNYASAVIRAARAHTDEIGCVAEKAVFQKEISFQGVDRLPSADEDLLLRAMVEIFLNKSLCIAEETDDGKQLIFPSQYRRERPISDHPEIFVSYTFTGELATIYTTLVVRLWYSRSYDNKELWRNAAEFTTTKGLTAGLMMTRTGEGQGTISIFFDPEISDDVQVVFIEYIHQHLHKYANEVHRERQYICNECGTPVKDFKTIKKRLDAKKDFIYCQNCDEKVKLIDHIEQRLGTDPVARTVYQMDVKATQELDNQAKEQIHFGEVMVIFGDANQIFRLISMFDMGIDGVVEFKDAKGKASGKKIYVQLKSGASHLRRRKKDGKLIFDIKNPHHLEYWVNQPVDVYLIISDAEGLIRWMNVTQYLKTRKNKASKQIIFDGEKLDAQAVLTVRKEVLGLN